MEKKTGSAGFDGKAFYFEEKNGTRWILLSVAEMILREGIRSMEAVRRQASFTQKFEAVLSFILAELRPMGGGESGLASSWVMLTLLDAMSWSCRPYRILRIGGHREDALSRGLEHMMRQIHPESEFFVAEGKRALPEGLFDGVLFDHLGGGREVVALEAKKRLRPGGLMLCVSGKKNGRNLLHLTKSQGEIFHCSSDVQVFLWERTWADWRKESRQWAKEAAPEELRTFQRKRVIAFFPYKSSMWGFMDSVWRAAAADKECVTYVIPVPYADLDKDKKVKEWHYDLLDFPPDVPVIDRDMIHVEHLRPDIAYIQNPYDDHNAVTQVEERFFARNLYPYVGQLVYIPYFMQGYCWAEHHLCTMGCHVADKIVVQKEHMRVAVTVAQKIKAGETCFVEDILPPEKLLPLGTPVTDRLLWCEEHKQIPEDWAERIRNRKVILYNTSVATLVNHGEAFLRKMEYVFHEVRGREDVVLLWRPHPLLEDTLPYANVPRERYWELKRHFLEEDWGILDTTPDAEMSIAIADAYMGDPSSMIYMFGVTGKPAFVTSVAVPGEGTAGNITAESFEPLWGTIPYAVLEDPHGRTVGAFLDYVAEGKHDREKQRALYAALTNHADGTCGAAIHRNMMEIVEAQDSSSKGNK